MLFSYPASLPGVGGYTQVPLLSDIILEVEPEAFATADNLNIHQAGVTHNFCYLISCPIGIVWSRFYDLLPATMLRNHVILELTAT